MTTSGRSIAIEWLHEMQSCVREVDYARCRAIFAGDVVGFGTKAAAAIGLDALERDQWRHIWGRIRHFTFALDGRKDEATSLLEGDFTARSEKLVRALSKWKGEAIAAAAH